MGASRIFEKLSFAHGPAMANRFMLAPLTNLQSHEDGSLSEDELHWLTKRAQGGFGMVMTCAAHVQPSGKGFPGQLGVWSDLHLPGLERLAKAINGAGSLSAVQLQHSGLRALPNAAGDVPRAPWTDADTGARALTTGEVEQLVEDFVLAGLRAETAGFNGVELHAAHGYMLGEFLDAAHNLRDDRYGGSFENRQRVLFEIITGLRARAGENFQIGVRISPERFGIPVPEARALAARLMRCGFIDYLDISMWDVFKLAQDEAYRDKNLVEYFLDLERGDTRLGVAGKIISGAGVIACLELGIDYVLIGRGAILHHDFPRQVAQNSAFDSIPLPVNRDHLHAEGLGPAFIDYMATGWKNFVEA